MAGGKFYSHKPRICATGIFRISRYLATVLLAIVYPLSARIVTSCRSVYGAFLFSFCTNSSMIVWMTRLLTLSPFSLTMPSVNRSFNRIVPKEVSAYLLHVSRDTVEISTNTLSAMSFNFMGFSKRISPYLKYSYCNSTIVFIIFSILDSRCWMALMNHCAEDSLLRRYCLADLSTVLFCVAFCTISIQDWLI